MISPYKLCLSAIMTHSRIYARNFSLFRSNSAKERINVTFVTRGNEKITVQGKVGESFLDVAVNNDVDLEGACEGTLSCSTCHIIFKPEDFRKLSSKPTDEELDMLDLAYGLTDTSRLGCQVNLTKEMDNIEVVVPEATSDARDI
ncbi:2Fe-2S ferredoxin-like isoform X2 [Artemia franciscana]|uniref:2Fe-2S ferredoxin-like isoform X2 n=1 Tax=Artemia franciscana TaxID=6661 RepID=UPI0032DB5531